MPTFTFECFGAILGPSPAARSYSIQVPCGSSIRIGEKYQFRFFSPSFGALPYNVATFSSDFTGGEIYLPRNGARDQRDLPV